LPGRPDQRQQPGGDLGERLGYPPAQVRVAGRLGVEGVEDAVGGVVDLEGVPAHGSLLGDGQGAGGLEELAEFASLAGLGFHSNEQAEFGSHARSSLTLRGG